MSFEQSLCFCWLNGIFVGGVKKAVGTYIVTWAIRWLELRRQLIRFVIKMRSNQEK